MQPIRLASDELIDDPYPTYARLLAEEPVYYSEETRYHYVARHELVCTALRDRRLSSNRVAAMTARLPEAVRVALAPFSGALERWMLFQDPPHHSRFRKVVNRALTARVVGAMQARIAELVEQFLVEADDDRADGTIDVIAHLAEPLPVIVISEMLGASPADRQTIKEWSDDLAEFLGAATDASAVARTQASLFAAMDYFRDIVARRRARGPGDDLLDALIGAVDDDPALTEDDLVANCVGLLFAGHETTTNLIANGLWTLLRFPAERTRLTAEPRLADSAVEECLRFESPVQRLSRVATSDIDIGGATVPAGSRVLFLLGAANRDPRQFDEPSRFDITRRDKRHLAFGHGPHLCSGAALARLEARLAITGVLNRYPRIDYADPRPRWKRNFGLRAMHELNVTVD